jgi:uncharacterized membrane protein
VSHEAEVARRAALAGLAGTSSAVIALPIAAGLAAPAAVIIVALSVLPLLAAMAGIGRAHRPTGRWTSLVLPFYAAGCLVAAAGDPALRGWASGGAFAAALAFAAVIAWVRRASRR